MSGNDGPPDRKRLRGRQKDDNHDNVEMQAQHPNFSDDPTTSAEQFALMENFDSPDVSEIPATFDGDFTLQRSLASLEQFDDGPESEDETLTNPQPILHTEENLGRFQSGLAVLPVLEGNFPPTTAEPCLHVDKTQISSLSGLAVLPVLEENFPPTTAEPCLHVDKTQISSLDVDQPYQLNMETLDAFTTYPASESVPVRLMTKVTHLINEVSSEDFPFEVPPLEYSDSLYECLPDVPGQCVNEEDEDHDHHNVIEVPGVSFSACLEDANLLFHETVEEDIAPDPNDPFLFSGASITVKESFISILSLVQSEHLSGKGLGRLLNLISLHMPESNNFFKSEHLFYDMLEKQEEPVQVFYFCSICYRSCASQKDLCAVCTDDTRTVQYFISFPLVPQLKRICERPGFKSNVQYKHSRKKQNPLNHEDIYDGELYKKVEANFVPGATNLTFMWNTDGLQIYKSSAFSLWPWYFVINELSPEKRFLSENLILGGIWGSTTKPHPNIYLQPIYKDVKLLEQGISVTFNGEECQSAVHTKVLCGTADAPATATFLNIKSHSGFCSCHVCECVGLNNEATGKVTVFPFKEDFPLRTVENYKDQVKFSVENKALINTDFLNDPKCCGVKGPTLLSFLVPDIFSSSAVDSMHCLYLGVTRQMCHLFFDHELRNSPFSLYYKIKTVNKRLKAIKVPHFVERIPQLIEKMPFWKASEFRTFLFYLALCVLSGLLDAKYLNHFMLFVQGVALLNQSSVSSGDILNAKMLLEKFVKDFQDLYGLRHMSHNLHKCLHLALVVENLAPLYIVSCFKYEDMNGRIAQLAHGSRHAGLQIYKNLSMVTQLPLLVHDLKMSPVKEYCVKLANKWMRLKLTEKVAPHLYCVGLHSGIQEKTWVIEDLTRNGYLTDQNNVSISLFYRLLKDKLLYVSKSYPRGQRISYCVQYNKNNLIKYGEIEVFVKTACNCTDACNCPREFLAVIKPLITSVAFASDYVSVQHIFKCQSSDELNDVVPLSDLQSIMYYVKLPDEEPYLCKPLNCFEME